MCGWMDADRCDPGVSSLCLSVCLSVCLSALMLVERNHPTAMSMIDLNPRLAGTVCSLFFFFYSLEESVSGSE